MRSGLGEGIRESMRMVGSVLFMLLALFALCAAIAGQNLELCFENSGNVRIESTAGDWDALLTEMAYHPASQTGIFQVSVNNGSQKHHDVPLSFIYTNEEWDTTYDWEHTLAYIGNALSQTVLAFPRSSAFQINSFIPPLIEDPVTSSLQTVVLLN